MDGKITGRPVVQIIIKIIKKEIYTVRAVVRWSWLGVTEVMVVHLPLL
jgi:hypothetical protein